MTIFSRRTLLQGILASGALLASGNVFSRAMAQEGASGVLRIASGEPTVLCSGVTSAIGVCFLSSKVFEGLLSYDLDLNPVGELAESFEFADDGLSMTFRLRPGAKWHDGVDVTSSDIKFSCEKVWRQFLARAKNNYVDLVSIDDTDPTVAVFTFGKPAFTVRSFLNSAEAPIMPAHIYDVEGDLMAHPAMKAPIGSGPFKFNAWEPAQYLEFVRNEDYWDAELPILERIVVTFSTDQAANAARLESGEVNYTMFSSVPAADVERLRSNPALVVDTSGYNFLGYVLAMEVNTRQGPLANKLVRQAVRAALDVQFIVDNVFYGFGRPSLGMLPSSSPWRNTEIADFAYDPERANALLDEAGFPREGNGSRFEIGLLYASGGDPRLPEYMRQALAQVGITLRLEPNELAVYLNRIYTSYEFDLTLNNLFLFNDPAIGMQRFLLESQLAPGLNFGNAGGWYSAELAARFAAAKELGSEDERRAEFNAIQAVLADEMPMIYVMENEPYSVYSANFTDHVITDPAPYGSFAKAKLA